MQQAVNQRESGRALRVSIIRETRVHSDAERQCTHTNTKTQLRLARPHVPPDQDSWLASLNTCNAMMALSSPFLSTTSFSQSLNASPSNGVSRLLSSGAGPDSPLHQRTLSPAALISARVTPNAERK